MNILTHKISGVYQIVNTINGHRYIGSAVDIRKRWKQHVNTLKRSEHHSVYLQRAWDKYGQDAFKFSVLETCFAFVLIFREQHYINLYHPEYNLSPTAGSRLGVKATEESRRKMSEAGKNKPPELLAAMSECAKGRKWTSEQRAKFIASMTGHKTSDETRAKISKANAGKPKSAEHRASLSAAKKGKTLSPEHRAKIGAAAKGNTYGKAGKGRTVTQAFREKMSAIKKARDAKKKQEKENNA